jgi:hypothetical protein
VSGHLDVVAVTAAGAAHGQIASALPGGLAVSGHKLVEEGARALLLILPGIVRVDVRTIPDGLQVMPRPLGELQLGWEVDPEAVTDYGKTALETELPMTVRFRIAFWGEGPPLVGRLIVGYTIDRVHSLTHFVGHAAIQEVTDDQ